MKTPSLRALGICLLLMAAAAATSLRAQTSPFTGQDVGSPQTAGSYTLNADGTITINGSGADIWNNSDVFYYYYTSVTGLVWEAKMRVVSLTGPDYWSKVELMVRRPAAVGTAPDGPDPVPNIEETQASQQNEIQPQWRGTRAGGSNNQGTGIPPSYPNAWLRITRSNSVFALGTARTGPVGILFSARIRLRRPTASTAQPGRIRSWSVRRSPPTTRVPTNPPRLLSPTWL